MSSPTPQVRVGVGAFILQSRHEPPNNPHFLIGKRLNSHGSGTWALPSGHLEFGETPEECTSREVFEETGLKVTNIRFLTATNDHMPADNKHYITMFTVCEREDDDAVAEVLEPGKCEGWEWVSWEELLGWAQRQGETCEGDGMERRSFVPLLNLVEQRPGVKPGYM